MGSGDGYSSSESGSERRHNHHNYDSQRHQPKRYEDNNGSSDDARKMRGDEKYRDREYDDDWVYGTFDCFEDPKTCLCGCFCVPCQVRSTASRLGEPGCLYWLMHCFVPCISLTLLRNKARKK